MASPAPRGSARRAGKGHKMEPLVIEIKERGDEAFYAEVVNVICQYRWLLREPARKLKDFFRLYKIYVILLAALCVLNLAAGIAWGFDYMGVIAVLLTGIACLFSAYYYVNLSKMKKQMMEDGHTSVLTVDGSGVQLEKIGVQSVTMNWHNVAFVRVFGESFCFLSKNQTGFVIAVTAKYKDEVLSYIKDNGFPVRIVE